MGREFYMNLLSLNLYETHFLKFLLKIRQSAPGLNTAPGIRVRFNVKCRGTYSWSGMAHCGWDADVVTHGRPSDGSVALRRDPYASINIDGLPGNECSSVACEERSSAAYILLAVTEPFHGRACS